MAVGRQEGIDLLGGVADLRGQIGQTIRRGTHFRDARGTQGHEQKEGHEETATWVDNCRVLAVGLPILCRSTRYAQFIPTVYDIIWTYR